MVGIDVVDVERLRGALKASPRLSRRLFSTDELRYSATRAAPHVHLAGTLAAKEAVAKALKLALPPNVQRIEILHDAAGAPIVQLKGSSERVDVSIAHDGPVAVAVATLAAGEA